jgi:hypothetical protein
VKAEQADKPRATPNGQIITTSPTLGIFKENVLWNAKPF